MIGLTHLAGEAAAAVLLLEDLAEQRAVGQAPNEEGTAAIRVDGVDRQVLKPGDYFGEISCLLGDDPVADIVAQRQLRCLTLPATQLEVFLMAQPRVMFRLLQGEARKLRITTRWQS